MSMIVITPESKNDERLRYQEICAFCYIATHLVDGVYKQANQFTASAVLDGERKTAERTIKRLVEKGVIHVVPPAEPGIDAPLLLRPVSFSEFWRPYWRDRTARKQNVQRSQNTLDKSAELSSGKREKVFSGKPPEKSTTSVPKQDASCPAAKPVGRVHNTSVLEHVVTGDCTEGQVRARECSACWGVQRDAMPEVS